MEQLKRSLAITKKNIKIYYSKGPVIIFGLIFPLFLYLAYTIGRNIPAEELMPGLVGMTAFFTATSVGPSIVPWETRSKTLERLICCPIAFWAIIFGDMLSSFLFGTTMSLISVLFALTLGIKLLNLAILLVGSILATFCFAAFSVLLSAYPPTDIPATVMMISSLVKFPLVFISGVFIPIQELPVLGRIVASISPLTYFVDLARHTILNRGYYPLTLDFAALVIFTLIFLVSAIKIHKRTLTKRIS